MRDSMFPNLAVIKSWWIYLLFLYYSYIRRVYPLSFLRLVSGGTIPYALIREPEVQERYSERTVEERNTFVNDLFGDMDKEPHTKFLINEFPYNVEGLHTGRCHHYVLWIKPGHVIESCPIADTISGHIAALNDIGVLGKNMPFFYFKNTNENKSIREVEHYHVFITSDDQGSAEARDQSDMIDEMSETDFQCDVNHILSY